MCWSQNGPKDVTVIRHKRRGCANGSPGAPAAYRLHAAHCVEIAARTADIENKLTLLDMASAWPLLAEQAEKNSETVYETHGIQHD